MRMLFILGLIIISSQSYGQVIFGEFIHIEKIETGQSFVTRLILKSDSTFQYSFKGDLFNYNAEGKFKVIDKLVILNYITPENKTVKYKNDFQENIEFKWSNPTAHLWPTELIIKREKLIVIKTKDNKEAKMKLKRVAKKQ